MASVVRYKMSSPENNNVDHVLSLNNDGKSLSEISAMIESARINIQSFITKYKLCEKKECGKKTGRPPKTMHFKRRPADCQNEFESPF